MPAQEQQSADELWGPVPNLGVVDFFAGANLSPQHTQSHTLSGIPTAQVQQLNVRRPRIKAYAGGKVVYFATWETKNLSRVGLVSAAIEDQWARTQFPGERDLLFLAYGRAIAAQRRLAGWASFAISTARYWGPTLTMMASLPTPPSRRKS